MVIRFGNLLPNFFPYFVQCYAGLLASSPVSVVELICVLFHVLFLRLF